MSDDNNVTPLWEAAFKRGVQAMAPQYRRGHEAGARLGIQHGDAYGDAIDEMRSSDAGTAFAFAYLLEILDAMVQDAGSETAFRMMTGHCVDAIVKAHAKRLAESEKEDGAP